MGMSKVTDELKKLVKPTLRPEDTVEDNWNQDKFKNKDIQSDKEWVELLWIWDKETEKRYLMTPTVKDQFLLEEDWPYYLCYEDDEFPVTILDGKKDLLSPYSFSEIRPIWDHINERDRVRSASLIHIKRAIPKYIGTKANTRAQVAKFMNSKSDEYTEMNNPQALMLAPVANNPPELQVWDAQLKDDLMNISGLFEFQANSIANTATEASLIQGRADVRKKKRTTEVEHFVVTCLAKLGMLCQQFQDESVAIAIDSEDQDTSWLNLNKEQIQGDFRYEIEPGIMEYKNEALQKQQVLKYAEIMKGNPHVDQRKLAVALSKVFDFSSQDILLPLDQLPKPPPPEPTITFKPIDLMEIPVAVDQIAIVNAAMEQNGVQIPQIGQPQPGSPLPQAPAAHPQPPQHGNPFKINEVHPMGGKVPLPPVEGHQVVQPASEANTNGL